jgi:hypothetical protein
VAASSALARQKAFLRAVDLPRNKSVAQKSYDLKPREFVDFRGVRRQVGFSPTNDDNKEKRQINRLKAGLD